MFLMNDETNSYSASPGFILTLQSENIIQKKTIALIRILYFAKTSIAKYFA